MRYLLALLFLSPAAMAAPDELHTCLAWFQVYEQTHVYDQKTSILKTVLELEMKKDKVYNAMQIDEAMKDKISMASASKSGKETKTTLAYCTKMSKDFIQ